MSEKIIVDLAQRLHDKIVEQMADYTDLCERAGCDRSEVIDYMLAIVVRDAMIGLISSGRNKKDILYSLGNSYDLVRPEVEKVMKKTRRR